MWTSFLWRTSLPTLTSLAVPVETCTPLPARPSHNPVPAQRSRKTWRRPSNPAGMSNFLSSRSNCSVPDLTVREILMMNEHMSNRAAAQNILTKTLLYKKQVQPKAAGENSNSLVILYFKQHMYVNQFESNFFYLI